MQYLFFFLVRTTQGNSPFHAFRLCHARDRIFSKGKVEVGGRSCCPINVFGGPPPVPMNFTHLKPEGVHGQLVALINYCRERLVTVVD